MTLNQIYWYLKPGAKKPCPVKYCGDDKERKAVVSFLGNKNKYYHLDKGSIFIDRGCRKCVTVNREYRL